MPPGEFGQPSDKVYKPEQARGKNDDRATCPDRNLVAERVVREGFRRLRRADGRLRGRGHRATRRREVGGTCRRYETWVEPSRRSSTSRA